MFKFIAKKFVTSQVNKLLDQHSSDVAKVKDTLTLWVKRLEKILGCFNGLLAKLDDNRLDDDEVDQAAAEIEIVVKEW